MEISGVQFPQTPWRATMSRTDGGPHCGGCGSSQMRVPAATRASCPQPDAFNRDETIEQIPLSTDGCTATKADIALSVLEN